jgi:hypothetical protein
MSPNGRINDAATGSISVLVTGSTGTPESGVSVTVTPVSSTATSLDTQPVATGPDGCTYAMGVAPGTYKVTLNRTGSVDTLQASSPFNDAVVVMPGATASVTFSYDQAMNYDLAYSTGSPVLPQKLPVTFLTASGAPYITSSSAAAPSTVALYPFPAGYTAIAGAEADKNGNTVCAAEDPAAWPGKTIGKGPGATVLAQGVRGAAPAAPGGSGTFTVPMGRFSLTNLNGLYVFAVAQNAATPTTGQPDCAAANGNALIFALGQITSAATTTFALPYGQYQIFTSTSASGTAPLPVGPAQNLSVSVPGQNTASTAGPGNALLLDPRVKS